jgi:hypothetical protein
MTTRLTPELLARIRQYPSNRISAAPSALLWAVEALLAELDAVTRERDAWKATSDEALAGIRVLVAGYVAEARR